MRQTSLTRIGALKRYCRWFVSRAWGQGAPGKGVRVFLLMHTRRSVGLRFNRLLRSALA